MIKKIRNILKIGNTGFSILEVLVSVVIFSLILLAIFSFISSMSDSNSKTKAEREASENAKIALDKITYEIRSANSVYTPTTTASQLSLETSRYLPDGENITFIDFFLCGDAICFKKEHQDPIVLTSDSVQVTNLMFSQVSTGASQSVKVDLTVSYPGSSNGADSSSISLTSTASLRSY